MNMDQIVLQFKGNSLMKKLEKNMMGSVTLPFDKNLLVVHLSPEAVVRRCCSKWCS